jgi:hypothetical protein
MKKALMSIILLSVVLAFSIDLVFATPVTVSTGDLGNNVINDAGLFNVSLTAETPSATIASEIAVNYGLWNSPPVEVFVSLNSIVLGSFIADNAYSTDPLTAHFNVTGYLVNGLNLFAFNGLSVSTGDYVIGQVDLSYDNSGNLPAPVPEPASAILLAAGLLGVAACKKQKSY